MIVIPDPVKANVADDSFVDDEARLPPDALVVVTRRQPAEYLMALAVFSVLENETVAESTGRPMLPTASVAVARNAYWTPGLSGRTIDRAPGVGSDVVRNGPPSADTSRATAAIGLRSETGQLIRTGMS